MNVTNWLAANAISASCMWLLIYIHVLFSYIAYIPEGDIIHDQFFLSL